MYDFRLHTWLAPWHTYDLRRPVPEERSACQFDTQERGKSLGNSRVDNILIATLYDGRSCLESTAAESVLKIATLSEALHLSRNLQPQACRVWNFSETRQHNHLQ